PFSSSSRSSTTDDGFTLHWSIGLQQSTNVLEWRKGIPPLPPNKTVRQNGVTPIVLGVSADSIGSHHGFCEKEGDLPFPLASDEDLTVAKAYGVYDSESKRSRRAVFVIDHDGTVMHAMPYYNPVNLNQFQEVFTALGLA
ncbi:MAG: redoxin domain-containing protein, partial [Dehalococcoidia bacterium]|nr:redoxin domain-containing protein [Dehalococcoidia bacterium]